MPVYYAAVLLWGGRACRPRCRSPFIYRALKARRLSCFYTTGAKTCAVIVILNPIHPWFTLCWLEKVLRKSQLTFSNNYPHGCDKLRVTFLQNICLCFVQHSSQHHTLDYRLIVKINLREVCIGAETTNFSPCNFPKFAFFFSLFWQSAHTKSITHIQQAVSYLLKSFPYTRILGISLQKIFIESFSPCFRYSCTAKMSFYCLLSLLINHFWWHRYQSFACCHKPNSSQWSE